MEKLTENEKKVVTVYDHLLDVNTRVGTYFPKLGSKELTKVAARSLGLSAEETENLLTSAVGKDASEVLSHLACRVCKEAYF